MFEILEISYKVCSWSYVYNRLTYRVPGSQNFLKWRYKTGKRIRQKLIVLLQRKARGGSSAGPRSNKRGNPTPVTYQRVKNEPEQFNRVKRTANETRLITVFLLLGWKHCYSWFQTFRRVLNVLCFLLGNSPASEFYIPTFRNTPSLPSS